MGARIHGTKTGECGAHCDTSETHLGNGGVDDTLLAELVEEALGDLARALELQRARGSSTHTL